MNLFLFSAASERVVQFALGWFAQPILVDGEYPQVMRDKIDRKSQEQGFSESRLPVFTDEQKILVANSSGSSNKNDISKDFEFSTFFKKYFHQYTSC